MSTILKSSQSSTRSKDTKLIKRSMKIQIWVIGQQCICLSVKFDFHNNMIALCLWDCLNLCIYETRICFLLFLFLYECKHTRINEMKQYKMMTAVIQVISYLNEIISLSQLRSGSSSWRAWNIRRLAICESFIYLKFPPNLLFKSTFHLRTVYNKNVSVFKSLTYLVSYFLYKFISRKQRTPVTSHHFFTDLVS